MKRVLYAIPVVALFATVAYSQAPGGQTQGQKIGLATSLQRGYNGFKTNFSAAAEKMPEADYSFKPGSTPEARTYAQVIAHIAQAQFGQCSGLKGVPNPMAGKQLEQELKTKAEVTKALADSFAMCDELFANLTDASATELVKAGQNEQTRAASLYGVLVHGNELYGTAAVYLRSKNIVPPSTENAQRGRRGGH
ncbi:MAG TPA: DinB family protein [Vicinamibacterales bacterium]|jgi:hypothetical protein|nr:DinB family protein [Vicinamibacterales bacterium]